MSIITYNGESKVIKRICELLDTMTGISFVVVQTLPTVDIQTNVIYLVPKQSAEVDNIYDEYINTDGTSQGWELIGTTEIDLTNYVQFSDLSTVATSGDYDDLIDKPTIPTDFVPKSTGGIFEGNVNIVRANSGTTNVNSVISLGNNKAVGTTGNTRGVLQLYDQNGKFTNLFPSDNASNLSYFLPKDRPNNSILLVEADIDNAICNIWNFLRFPYYNASPRTTNGITFTVDSDGNIIANNTATGTATFNLRASGENFIMPKNATYKLSGCPSGGSDSKYRLRIGFQTSGGTNLDTYYDYGEGVTFQIPSTASRAYIQAQVLTGQTATNLTFRPKLEKLSDWVDLGSQTLDTTITLTEQYSELMFVSEINNYGKSFNLPVLRVQLSTTHSHFTDGMGLNDLEVWLDGSSIKFIINSATPTDVVKLYAKA